MTATPRAIELLQIAARAADDKQADDLVALDVSEPLALTDIFLLASGRSERNVVAIAGEIEDKMLEAGARTLRRDPAIASARLIAISAYGMDDYRQRSLEAGFDLFMPKPIDLEQLQRLLAAVPSRNAPT